MLPRKLLKHSAWSSGDERSRSSNFQTGHGLHASATSRGFRALARMARIRSQLKRRTIDGASALPASRENGGKRLVKNESALLRGTIQRHPSVVVLARLTLPLNYRSYFAKSMARKIRGDAASALGRFRNARPYPTSGDTGRAIRVALRAPVNQEEQMERSLGSEHLGHSVGRPAVLPRTTAGREVDVAAR